MTSRFAQPPSQIQARARRAATTSCIVLGLLLTVPALADQSVPIDIRWESPSGCPQERDVREQIDKVLGTSRHDTAFRVEGTITRNDRRYRLELVLHVRDLVGTRTLESSSCKDFDGAAAVEIGLLIHSAEATVAPIPLDNEPPPSSASKGPETTSSTVTKDAIPDPPKASEPKPESKPEVEPEITKPPSPEPSQRSWHAIVQAPLLARGKGPLPQSATGVGAAFGLEFASWQLQINALAWQRQTVQAQDLPMYGAEVDRITAALWTCHESRLSWFGFSPCLTTGLERVAATGTGRNIVPSTQHAIRMTAGPGVQGRVYLANWIRLLTAVGAQIDLSHPQISLAGIGSVYNFTPLSLTIALGLEWSL